MEAKTIDGSTVTTIEQDGDYAGEEIGRVWIKLRGGWAWWGMQSVARAEQVVQAASAYTASGLDDAIDQGKV